MNHAAGLRRSRRFRLAACLVASVAMMGCASASTGEGGFEGGTRSPSKRGTFEGITRVQTVVAPGAAPVARYAAPVDHALGSTEQAILKALGHLPVQHMPALSRMTREVARTAPDRTNIPAALIDGLMAWAGLVDPPPRLIVVEMPNEGSNCARNYSPVCRGAVQALVEQVESSLPSGSKIAVGVGVAGVGNATRMIVSILERAVEMDPIPKSVPMGQSVRVAGRLLDGRSRPTVEIVDPRGRWVQLPTGVSIDGSFEAMLRCDSGRGAVQVELLAEGRHGPEVAANFPVYCGTGAPQKMTVELERLAPDVTPEQVAQANFTYLNEERRRRGLPPLQWDERAADIAHAHSLDMQRNGFVGHRSPSTGDVRHRFERGRLQGTVIRENVARGYGPKGIHDSLMRSPGHRINIMAADVTHVGIGVVIGPPETSVVGAPRPIFATQNFYRTPGAGAPADAQLVPGMRQKVDALRKQRDLPAVHWDPALMTAAGKLVDAFAKGKPAPKGFEQAVFAAGYNSVESVQARSADFEALAGVDVWSRREVFAGLGMVRVRGRDGDEFVMVVLVAEK